MSTTVLAIGLGHAIFPIIGYFAKNKIGLLLGTIIGILIAILLGGSRYSAIDLIGVGLGVGICFYFIKESKEDEEDE